MYRVNHNESKNRKTKQNGGYQNGKDLQNIPFAFHERNHTQPHS